MSDKLAKEAFVSGLSGTSFGEISLLTVTLSAGYLLRCVAIVSMRSLAHSSLLLSFLTEYATIVLPGVLVFTVLADYAVHVLVSLLFASLLVASYGIWNSKFKFSQFKDMCSNALTTPYNRRLPFVTLFRTYITLFTAIAILAVDFTIFPRRLAKAETYGSGLMDIGVGTFMMAHGITAPESRCQNDKKLSLRSYLKLLFVTLRNILPLLVVGLLRLIFVKGTDYQEHVTEYGVHWNFFFTVAVVRLLCSLLQPLLHAVPRLHLYGLVSILLGSAYQWCLSRGGVAEYIDGGPHGDGSRPTLFSANREGILSCAGYLAVYLASIELGQWLFRHRQLLKEYTDVLLKLVILDVLLWCLTWSCHVYAEPVSRRYANLTYVLWTISYGVMMLAVFLVIDILVHILCHALHKPLPPPYSPHPPPSISRTQYYSNNSQHVRYSDLCFISVVDFNQLAFFLLANIFTGLVNFSVATLSAGRLFSVVVLLVYTACLMAIFTLMHRFSIKIKL